MAEVRFLSDDLRERMLLRWEKAVVDYPVEAWNAGPPNWLVMERKKRDETIWEAANRIRSEYFPGGVPWVKG